MCCDAVDAGLRKHFENAISSAGGSMRSGKVAMRKGPDGKPLSMGFGFVECSSEDVAKAVLKQLQVGYSTDIAHCHKHECGCLCATQLLPELQLLRSQFSS